MSPDVSPDSQPFASKTRVSSGPVSTAAFAGLSHLEGKKVVCLGDGHVFDNLTVKNGAITLPVPVSKAVAGLPYTAELETMELEPLSNSQLTAPAGKLAAVASIHFYHSRECSYGRDGEEHRIEFRDADERHPSPIRPKTIRKNVLVATPIGDNRATFRLVSRSPVPFGVLSVEIKGNLGDLYPNPGRAG